MPDDTQPVLSLDGETLSDPGGPEALLIEDVLLADVRQLIQSARE